MKKKLILFSITSALSVHAVANEDRFDDMSSRIREKIADVGSLGKILKALDESVLSQEDIFLKKISVLRSFFDTTHASNCGKECKEYIRSTLQNAPVDNPQEYIKIFDETVTRKENPSKAFFDIYFKFKNKIKTSQVGKAQSDTVSQNAVKKDPSTIQKRLENSLGVAQKWAKKEISHLDTDAYRETLKILFKTSCDDVEQLMRDRDTQKKMDPVMQQGMKTKKEIEDLLSQDVSNEEKKEIRELKEINKKIISFLESFLPETKSSAPEQGFFQKLSYQVKSFFG